MVEANKLPISTKKHRVFLLSLWTLSLALLPVYLAPSGTPQISHFVLTVLIAATFVGLGLQLPLDLRDTPRALAWFVAYVAAVNSAWAILTGDLGFAVSASFYLFNYFVFRTVLVLYSSFGKRFLTLTVKTAMIVLLALAAATLVFGQPEAFRSAAFFNNPNQLAYYTVIVATVAALGTRNLRLRAAWQVAFYASAVYLAAVANSKAGYMALAVLALIVLIKRPSIALGTALAVVIVLQLSFVARERVGNVVTRVTSIEADDSFAGRGYLLPLDHPEYIALGAGEGDYARFSFGKETHSTWLTVAFAYGLPGVLLFGIFLLRLIRQARLGEAIYLLPIGAYGISHNGLRFTMLWVLLAFVIASGQEGKRSAQGR